MNIGKYADHLDEVAASSEILFKEDAFYALPAIVNISFACELYLKALLSVVAGTFGKRGHKLAELFSCLPEDCKERLRKNFSKEVKGRISLDETMKIHSDSFLEWRYAYESMNCNIEAYPGNIIAAAKVFQQEILNHKEK